MEHTIANSAIMFRMSHLLTTCRRSLRCMFRILAWIPVVFVSIILVWGYYVYVYVVNISGVFPSISDSPALSLISTILFLLVAHVIFCLQVASYVRTIFTEHRAIPEEFLLTDDQLDQLDQAVDEQTVLQEVASHLPVQQLSRGGGIRYCDSCELIKPDRCHHCSMCNRCVLKMDHHCPWVNNCVGFSNYKYFVLFLAYTVALCVWLCTTGLNAFINAWGRSTQIKSSDKFQVIFWYFLCVMFGISTLVLASFHLYLLLFNKTTLENMQPPCVAGSSNRHRPYFIGFKNNIQQVFGRSCIFALIPIASSEGNGVVYPIKRGIHHVQNDLNHTEENLSEIEMELNLEREPLTNTQT